MTAIRTICLALVVAFCASIPAQAQMGSAPCIDTCTGNLRSLSQGNTPYAYIFVEGYYAAGDGGGGSFYLSSPACSNVTQTTASWSTSSPNTIIVSGTPVPSVGMAIAPGQGSIGLPAYDAVVATGTGSITLASPITMTGSATAIYFTSDNGGGIIRDNGTSPPVCYTRATWTYSQLEWGAYGNNSNDDT